MERFTEKLNAKTGRVSKSDKSNVLLLSKVSRDGFKPLRILEV